jgi:hypothetical protein
MSFAPEPKMSWQRRRAQRGIGDLFDENAYNRAGKHRHQHGEKRMQVEVDHTHPSSISTHHDNITVGKVQKKNYAIDHAISQCHQCVNRA